MEPYVVESQYVSPRRSRPALIGSKSFGISPAVTIEYGTTSSTPGRSSSFASPMRGLATMPGTWSTRSVSPYSASASSSRSAAEPAHAQNSTEKTGRFNFLPVVMRESNSTSSREGVLTSASQLQSAEELFLKSMEKSTSGAPSSNVRYEREVVEVISPRRRSRTPPLSPPKVILQRPHNDRPSTASLPRYVEREYVEVLTPRSTPSNAVRSVSPLHSTQQQRGTPYVEREIVEVLSPRRSGNGEASRAVTPPPFIPQRGSRIEREVVEVLTPRRARPPSSNSDISLSPVRIRPGSVVEREVVDVVTSRFTGAREAISISPVRIHRSTLVSDPSARFVPLQSQSFSSEPFFNLAVPSTSPVDQVSPRFGSASHSGNRGDGGGVFAVLAINSTSAQACVRGLLARFPDKVDLIRAGSREGFRTESFSLTEAEREKVEIVENISFEKPDSMRRLFGGAKAAFVVMPMDMVGGNSQRDAELVMRLGAIVDVAIEEGVKHLVYVGSWTVNEPGRLSMTASRFLAAEALLKEKEYTHGLKWTVLRAGFFASNLLAMLSAGVVEANQVVFPEGVQFPPIDATDVGQCAAVVLVQGEPHFGRCYELSGSQLVDGDRVADCLTKLLGRHISAVNIPIKDFVVGLPPAVAQLLTFCAEEGALAVPFTTDVQLLTGSVQKGFDSWLASNLSEFETKSEPAGAIVILPNFDKAGIECVRDLVLYQGHRVRVLCWSREEVGEMGKLVGELGTAGQRVEVKHLKENDFAAVADAVRGYSSALLSWSLDISRGIKFDSEQLLSLNAIADAAISAGVSYIAHISSWVVTDPAALSMVSSRFLAAEAMLCEKEATHQLKWTCLRSALTFDFVTTFIGSGVRRNDGILLYPEGGMSIAAVDTGDVGRSAAAVLGAHGHGHFGRSYNLTGPELLDENNFAEILAAPEEKLTVCPIPVEEYTQHLSPPLAQLIKYLVAKHPAAFPVTQTVPQLTDRHTNAFQWATRPAK